MRSITELARALEKRINTERSEVAIVELNETNDTIVEPILRFQYFPASIQDSYQTSYASQAIPGGSLPISQWVSGGPRTISFEAFFTCDTDLLAKDTAQGIEIRNRLKDIGQGDRNIDIRSALVWLRRFMLPRYTSGELGPVASLTYGPRKMMLVIPNSGIGSAGGERNKQGAILGDSIYCHMTQCDITYQMFHPSGLPKIVKVQLSFEQIPQIGGDVIFPSVSGDLDDFVNPDTTDNAGYFGYPLRSTGKARVRAAASGLESAVVANNRDIFE